MNIWVISKYAALRKSDLGLRLFYLSREFRRNGHNVFLVTSNANHHANFPKTKYRYNYEEIEGVNVCWIKTRQYRKTASIGRVLSWLDFEWKLFKLPRRNRSRPDVVIVSSLSLLSVLYGYFLKKRYGSFLVFEVRDIWPLTMVEEGGFSQCHPLVIILALIEKFGYRNADLIVGTMPRLDFHVRDVIGRDRPFFCSPLGYAPETIRSETAIPSNIIDSIFPKGKLVIGYAGSMGIANALEPLMLSMERLSTRMDIHFVLVGEGDLKDAYMARMAAQSNVTFVPRIERDCVLNFLRRCDALYLSTHPSGVWQFGQSMNKILDYMMVGKPIIASYSGYRSMINEANSGIFVEAGDTYALIQAIIRIAEMPAEARLEMGERGRQWVLEKRPYVVLGKEYLTAIERILKRAN